jgi:4-hydroxybenzoate polyprenyltransferase
LKKTMALLRLMRPANIVTAVADILAGITISGFFVPESGIDSRCSIFLLCIATIGLYGGGVVFNDVFDASLDAVERPERPIPSGLVSRGQAVLLGTVLLIAGISCAGFAGPVPGIIAVCIAAAALVYDKWGKHQDWLGPLNMGLCRGLNLLLGMSSRTASLSHGWLLAAIPVLYIAAITMISRGEVHGGKRRTLYLAALLYSVVIGCILYFASGAQTVLLSSLFLLFFAWMIFGPLVRAIRLPAGKNIGKAVKAGVISLILMDAALAAASSSPYAALVIALLLPVSLGLSRLFAVT